MNESTTFSSCYNKPSQVDGGNLFCVLVNKITSSTIMFKIACQKKYMFKIESNLKRSQNMHQKRNLQNQTKPNFKNAT